MSEPESGELIHPKVWWLLMSLAVLALGIVLIISGPALLGLIIATGALIGGLLTYARGWAPEFRWAPLIATILVVASDLMIVLLILSSPAAGQSGWAAHDGLTRTWSLMPHHPGLAAWGWLNFAVLFVIGVIWAAPQYRGRSGPDLVDDSALNRRLEGERD